MDSLENAGLSIVSYDSKDLFCIRLECRITFRYHSDFRSLAHLLARGRILDFGQMTLISRSNKLAIRCEGRLLCFYAFFSLGPFQESTDLETSAIVVFTRCFVSTRK